MNKNKKALEKKIHLGQAIQQKLNTSGLTVTEFAEKIGLSRPAVYQMFNKQSVDSDLLVRISLLLKENFVKHIYQEVEEQLQDKKESTGDEESCHEAKNKVFHKLELIHQDLLSIKNVLIEIKELKV
ncbi:MAG: hypothetical protein KatS3mg027_0459 [Bacteroidia bacterium]|nr:MAG: hypothetical protein KatS3mg027_0459 [Bacteroidia bacterium]